MEEQGLIFITGGARSGKSTFAERYAASLAEKTDGNLHYIATSKPTDREMKERIARHQRQRQESGLDWKTTECPVDLPTMVDVLQQNDIVLLDCLTVLLTNELFREGFSENLLEQADYQETVMQTIWQGIKEIRTHAKTLLIVSNEVLHEPMIDSALVHVYCRLLGKLHQQIVRNATEAYVVAAGVPIAMKGANVR
ncbi:bifunctional adenosylcobinamide kinase/adenosylcobinamide-phosphate guanylyltransferase [Virgibacillus sp. FSP13]